MTTGASRAWGEVTRVCLRQICRRRRTMKRYGHSSRTSATCVDGAAEALRRLSLACAGGGSACFDLADLHMHRGVKLSYGTFVLYSAVPHSLCPILPPSCPILPRCCRLAAASCRTAMRCVYAVMQSVPYAVTRRDACGNVAAAHATPTARVDAAASRPCISSLQPMRCYYTQQLMIFVLSY